MRVLVAGATGHTGLRLVSTLLDRGHMPIALVREGSNTDPLPSQAEQRLGDLTDLPDDICEGVDAVVFAAGSGSSTGKQATEAVDRDGAKRLIDRAKQAGVSRFVMLSSVGASDPDPDSELHHYLKAKHDADAYLASSGLDYAILRPVALTQDDGQGHVRLGDDVDPSGKAARGDVAIVLADALVGSRFTGQALRMESLDTPAG